MDLSTFLYLIIFIIKFKILYFSFIISNINILIYDEKNDDFTELHI